MEWDEVNGIVWKYLAEKDQEIILGQISEDIGFSDEEIRKSVSALSNIGIVKKEKVETKFTYKANLVLSSLQWARAAEIGIPVEHLERFAKLKNESENPLLVATDGTLEKHKEDEIKEKTQRRKDYIYGKAATEAAATDLSHILKNSADALKEWKMKERDGELTLKEKLVTTLLEQTHNEMKRSYNVLINSLVRKSL